MNGGSNSHSLNGSTPSTLPGGDFDQISTRNEHFASLARSRPPPWRPSCVLLASPAKPVRKVVGPTRDSGNLGRESCCFANQARVNGGSNSHSLEGSTPSTVPGGDFDKISTRNVEHFTSPRSLSLSHTRTRTHAVSAGSLDEGRGHQANTSLLAPATFHNSQRAADARARAPASHSVVGNLHLPGAGIEPACAVERARRRALSSSQKREHCRKLDLVKKKKRKKRFQKTLKTTHEQAAAAAETAGPLKRRAFLHRDSRFAEEVSVQSGQIFESKGLVSIDRSKAAALLSTTPRLQPRSSTNDLAPLHCMGWVSLRHGARPARRTPECRQLLWLVTTGRAEIGRRPHIVASQRRGANGTVTLLGGILT